MDYEKHYNLLIDRARIRQLPKDGRFTEEHHILPECMDGPDIPENRCILTLREHFIAHILLMNMRPGVAGLVVAAMRMLWSGNDRPARGQRRDRRRSKQYAMLRRRNAEVLSERFRGRKFSPETIARMCAAQKKYAQEHPRTPEQNAAHAAKLRGRKNGPCSPERKRRIATANRGKKRSPESVEKMRAAKLGKKRCPHTVETKIKMSAASLGLPKSTAHCVAITIAKGGIKSLFKPPSNDRRDIERFRRTQDKIAFLCETMSPDDLEEMGLTTRVVEINQRWN